MDLAPQGLSAFVMEPPAFQLHRYTPETGLVTHLAYVEISAAHRRSTTRTAT